MCTPLPRPAQSSVAGWVQLGQGCPPEGCFCRARRLCLHFCGPQAGRPVLETTPDMQGLSKATTLWFW